MPDAQIHLTGNLADAPEVRYLQDGTAVASASVAVNKSKKIANTGDPKQDYETLHTTWYRVSWWREIAEAVGQMNLAKGQTVTIDGEVYEEQWTSRDGKEGKSLVVTATGCRAFPKREQSQQSGYSQAQQGYGQQSQQPPAGDPWQGGDRNGYDSPPF